MISIKEILELKNKSKNTQKQEIELLDMEKDQDNKEETLGTIVVNDIISSDIIDKVEEEKEQIRKNVKLEEPESNIQIKLEETPQIKDLEIGKNQKNIMKKSAELTKIEILELVKQILEMKKLDVETKSLISKYTEKYIKYKYFFEGELKKDYEKSELQENIREEIQAFGKELEKTRKYSKKNINKVKNAFLVINDINFSETSIIKILKENNILFEQATAIKKIIVNYNKIYTQFLKKLDNKNFNLILTRYGLTNTYISNIRVNMKFNPIFSREGIEKAFHSELVVEDLKNIQLRLLSIKIFEDWLNFSLKEKYLIYFPDTLYKKSRKLYNILNSIDDSYSQSKIMFIVTFDILLNYRKTIVHLKKRGYCFVMDCSIEELNKYKEMTKELCLFDNIFVYVQKNNKQQVELPESIKKNIIYGEERLVDIEGGIIS